MPITPRECARLQGLPDWFRLNLNDTYAYRQIGNGVSVPVVEQLFSNYFENNSIPMFND
ncbi:MAG: DNA cytosine methyltransferase [Armatimonadetes bacterium]|nr:DNA cytosine methyltransferase [Armatimonadota bacterium]